MATVLWAEPLATVGNSHPTFTFTAAGTAAADADDAMHE